MISKQIIKEKHFLPIVVMWLVVMIGYVTLWRTVLPITILTAIIILGLLLFILILFIGLAKKLDFKFYLGSFFVSFVILIISLPTLPNDTRWRVENTVLAYERALDFNRKQLNSKIEDRWVSRSHSRSWHNGGSVSLEIMTRPNYRFTKDDLEEFSRITAEIENLYRDASFISIEKSIWIRYSHDSYWLRTYPTEIVPFTMTRRAELSTIYNVDENIAVVEVRFPLKLTSNVLRLPLVDQHGEFHRGNFELALQLQQLMLYDEIVNNGLEVWLEYELEEDTRSFELAREIIAELAN